MAGKPNLGGHGYINRAQFLSLIDELRAATGKSFSSAIDFSASKGSGKGVMKLVLGRRGKPDVHIDFTTTHIDINGEPLQNSGYAAFSRKKIGPRDVMQSGQDTITRLVTDVLDLCPEAKATIETISLSTHIKEFENLVQRAARGEAEAPQTGIVVSLGQIVKPDAFRKN